MTEEEIHQRFQEAQARCYGITPRMREHLQLYANGCTVQQVQKVLNVTQNTVYGTRRRILELLGADTMTHAVAIGLRTRMIS